MTEQEYRKVEAVSYSMLSSFDKSLLGFKARYIDGAEFQPSSYMNLGSAVDCMVTTPDEFKKTFKVVKREALPTETIQKIIDVVYQEVGGKDKLEDHGVVIVESAKSAEYQGKWKDETIINKIVTEGSEYFEILKIADDDTRRLINEDTYYEAVSIVQKLKDDPWTQWMFDPKEEIMFQVPILWTETIDGKEVPFKALVDIMRKVDGVWRLYDLKVTDNVNGFLYVYKKLRYYIQSSLYRRGASMSTEIPVDDSHLTFITVDNSQKSPLMYRDENDCSIGIPRSPRQQNPIDGWTQIYNKMKWHKENDVWNHTKEAHENEGVILIPKLWSL